MTLSRPICSPSLLTFFLALATSASAVTVSGLSNETDYQALLAFKSQLTSDTSQGLTSWNGSLHFCDWEGVTCGKTHQRVTRLVLPSLGLVGPLSPLVGNLSFLRVLILDDNGFHGVLPQEIGRLSRLQNLSLQENSFEGEVPANLTNCGDLSILDLRGNSFRGRISRELGSMLRLTRVALARNHFIGGIPPSLANLSALTHLSLSYNHLEGSVPPELGNLSNLTFLQIGSNNLSGAIPTPLYNMSSMKLFGVAFNNLSGTLPSDLFLKFPKLQMLYVGGNRLSGQVPASITNASQLMEFYLASNSFVGRIPKDLGALAELQELGFGGNLLGTHEGYDLIFLTSLTNCSQLRIVALEDNRLKGALPDSIGKFSATSLTILSLTKNLVSGTIPSAVGDIVDLELLQLGENMLVGKIPESIGKLTKLKSLWLHRNNISGMIPSSVGNMTALSDLTLYGNKLEGPIPNSIGNCTNLNVLYLYENCLTGPIPKEIFSLASLSIGLLLGQNYLTGTIPAQVGTLVNLGVLGVSGNNMTGEIPSSIGDCQVLELLDLGGNQFTGSIPTSISNLRGLESLDVSQNNLSGQIPGFLANLPLVKNLNLSFNMFEGEVPIFGNLSAVSIAGNNKLCGGPPTLQLPKCKAGPQRDRKRSLSGRRGLAISVSVSIFILLAGGIITTILCRSKRSRRETTLPSLTEDHHPKLGYAELSRATDGFSLTNVIGEGSFGVVYRGVLPSNGQVVAVKVLKLEERGASKSFMAECEALRNVRHRNLVKTITSCSSIDFQGEDFKALVFDFLPNGSLDKWVHPVSDDSTTLGVLQRVNIAIDAVTALDYLHNSCDIPIVHCDLKPSNVLLDTDFSAHLSDFGLAKFLMDKEASGTLTSSIGIRGTIGYVAPEYGISGEVSTRGDVYSFGILLLELFTGKRPTGPMFSGEFGLREFVEAALPDRLNEVMDPLLHLGEVQGDDFHQCLVMILRVGLMCSAAQPTERMGIGEAAEELRKGLGVLQVPMRRNRL